MSEDTNAEVPQIEGGDPVELQTDAPMSPTEAYEKGFTDGQAQGKAQGKADLDEVNKSYMKTVEGLLAECDALKNQLDNARKREAAWADAHEKSQPVDVKEMRAAFARITKLARSGSHAVLRGIAETAEEYAG